MKTKIFYVGLFLVLVSFIGCVVNFYLIFFGIPVFIIGALLVLFSDRTIKSKLLLTITPVVLYIPSVYVFLYLYNYSTPKTILIPENYHGPLRVVYEEHCGTRYREEKGETILSFPKDGILILNEEFDNHVNYRYYFVDKAGKRTEIAYTSVAFDKSKKELPCVEFSSSGSIGQTVTAGDDMSSAQKEIVFSDFYVYTKDTVRSYDYKESDKFNAYTEKVVNECRGE